uniref:Uncharacterized protein n=1 Tax=Lotus japonicus TaxID=34305 RepID=I3SVE0_LOTJA|nr:unknown [Lotus japonicus]
MCRVHSIWICRYGCSVQGCIEQWNEQLCSCCLPSCCCLCCHGSFCIDLGQEHKAKDDIFNLCEDSGTELVRASYCSESVFFGNEVHNSNLCSFHVQYPSCHHFPHGLHS